MSNSRKGIILAGGTGSRLWPVTMGVSKQLLPVFDKPMLFYPLSVLMLCGIREVAVITEPRYRPQFETLLGDGKQWGLNLSFYEQAHPNGLAEAYLLCEHFLDGDPSALVLGDNLFFGHGLPNLLSSANARSTGGTVFGYRVSDPQRYGVVEFDDADNVVSIVEKPHLPASNYAVTGLYFLDQLAVEYAKTVRPSPRGELEITDILECYRENGNLNVERMGRGYAWLDTGTHESLLEAGNFVKTLQSRQGLLVGSPDEIAYSQGWISEDAFHDRIRLLSKSEYGAALANVLAQ